MKNKVTIKTWILFFGILIMSVCSSCMHHSEQQSESRDNSTISQEDMFKIIYTDKRLRYYVVYDVETNVEYMVSNGANNRGTFVMRVDSTGKPKLHKH